MARESRYTCISTIYTLWKKRKRRQTFAARIRRDILGIPNVVDANLIAIPYSLMATAYGLSIQRIDDKIVVSRKEDLFAKYTDMDEQQSRWNAHREHGMYED